MWAFGGAGRFLLELCAATESLLTLLGDGWMRELEEQGVLVFDCPWAQKGPQAPKWRICPFARNIEFISKTLATRVRL